MEVRSFSALVVEGIEWCERAAASGTPSLAREARTDEAGEGENCICWAIGRCGKREDGNTGAGERRSRERSARLG